MRINYLAIDTFSPRTAEAGVKCPKSYVINQSIPPPSSLSLSTRPYQPFTVTLNSVFVCIICEELNQNNYFFQLVAAIGRCHVQGSPGRFLQRGWGRSPPAKGALWKGKRAGQKTREPQIRRCGTSDREIIPHRAHRVLWRSSARVCIVITIIATIIIIIIIITFSTITRFQKWGYRCTGSAIELACCTHRCNASPFFSELTACACVCMWVYAFPTVIVVAGHACFRCR